jgi:insulysin
VEDSLTEYAYDAELAGLHYSILNHSQGLDVSVGGYNDKMSVLLEKVLITMRDLKITDERFDIMKERLTRSFKNFDYTEPFRQITTYSRWLSSERG